MPDFTTTLIQENFYSISQGHVRCFLMIGDREALLVDAGLGGSNLRETVEELTNRPVKVLFTHADGDHVGHAAQFERRFMHPSEFDHYRAKSVQAVTMEPVWEGEIIDLGTFCFEVILLPGHTPGSIALLEKEKRFLIGGDSIQTSTIFMFGPGRNFSAFQASMKKLQARLAEFDTVYASHGALAVDPETVCLLDAAAEKVMANAVEGKPHGRNFDDSVQRFDTNGVSFFATRQ